METHAAITLGIFIGWGTLGALIGVVRLVSWVGSTDRKIAMLEAQFKVWVRAFQTKGKQDDDRKMVEQKPA